LIGVISGGVTVAVVAGTINNIGACIAIGFVSGFISSFYYRILHDKI
jgi:ammonia channel protein AmtB